MDYPGNADASQRQIAKSKLDSQHAACTKKRPKQLKSRRNSAIPTTSKDILYEMDQLKHALKYPCNPEGTFKDEFKLKCPFCKSKMFDRPDYFTLHYGESHARLYGPLSDCVIEKKFGTNSDSKGSAEPIRKRRRSIYVNENLSNSEFEEENANINCIETNSKTDYAMHVAITKILNKKRKENATETHPAGDLNEYRSDVAFQTILTCANEIQSILVLANEKNIELNKKIAEYMNYEKNQKNKRQEDHDQTTLVYKCKQCYTHFLSSSKLVRHLQRRDHKIITFKCQLCGLSYSKKSETKHLKMHDEGKFINFKVTSQLITSSDSESIDDTDDEKYNLNSEISNKATSQVSSTSGIANGASTMNNNTDKIELYQCDECEVNFFDDIKYLRFHLNDSTHHFSEKRHICDVANCQLKFKTSSTLERHKSEHHNEFVNLTKDDFKFIYWKGERLPKKRKTTSSKYFQHSKKTIKKRKMKKLLSKRRTPKVTKKSNVHEPNIVSTIQENSSMEAASKEPPTKIGENESCKVKLTKTVNNNWRVDHEEFENNMNNNNLHKEHNNSSKQVEPDCAEVLTNRNANNNLQNNVDSLNDNMTEENDRFGERVMASNSCTKEQFETAPAVTNVRSLLQFEDFESQKSVNDQTSPKIRNCNTPQFNHTELEDVKEEEIDIHESVNTADEAEINGDSDVDVKDDILEYHSDDSQATLLLSPKAPAHELNYENLDENNVTVERDISTETDVKPEMENFPSNYENNKQPPSTNGMNNFSVKNRSSLNVNQTKISNHFPILLDLKEESQTDKTPLEKRDQVESVVSISDDEIDKCDGNIAIEISDDEDLYKVLTK